MKKFIKVNFIILVIFSLLAIQSFAEEIGNFNNQEQSETSNEEQDNDSTQNAKTEELKEQKKELEQQSEVFNSQLEFVSGELSDTVVEVSQMTQNIYEKQTEFEELTAKSNLLEKTIENVEQELEKATDEYEKQKDLLEKRLVAMYEMGSTSYLDLLLNSNSISEFLSNYYYISQIATTDSELLNIVQEQKEKREDLKGKLQTNQEQLDNSRAELEKASIAISNMVILKNQKIQELSEEETLLQKQVEEYQSQIQEIESEIRLLSLLYDNKEYVGGTMIWPVPGYTRISSSFGMRTHPITGVYKLHTGTDISAPYGSIFVASNSGIVTKAGYNTAYGNMVIIDHGGGISTLYAHGSEILVEVGQTVNQGTPVLKVGSTGYSTGPHAHFEIRINGEYVNPMDYLNQDINKNKEKQEPQTVELETNTENTQE